MTLTPRWKLILQIAVTLLVIVFVTIAFWKPLQQLAQHDLDLHYGSLIAAGVVYALGLVCSCTFWWLSLLSLGQRPVPIRVPWAYFIGHLAKYVPGKALVVLLRTVLVRGPHCRLEVAATTVVYETVVFMGVGSIFAALVVLVYGPLSEHLNYVHIALLLAGAVPFVIPPVFNAIMRRLTAPLRELPDGTHAPFPRLGMRILSLGILLQTGCTILVGVSLAFVILAVRPDVNPWPMLPELIAKLAAATVLGFVIPTPAGLGTREWAIMVLLQDQVGADYSALIALLTRLTWLVTETVIVLALFPIRNAGTTLNSSLPAPHSSPDQGSPTSSAP